jgi:hypothetical protein
MAGRRGARYAQSDGGPRGVLEEFGSIKLRGGVMMRITLDILDLAKLGETVPPRDPDDDDESEDEEDDDRNEDLEPAVIREPDE